MSTPRIDPPGTTPWDRWAGARVGGLAGAIISAIPAVWIDPFPFGIVVACAALGATVGFFVEYRRGR
jgi:hypothetical protein